MDDDTPWRVIVTPKAEKELKRSPAAQQARILTALDRLTTNPRQGDLRKLQGTAVDEWRLRVGEWSSFSP